MNVILSITDPDTGLEVNARIAQVEGGAWLGYTLGANVAALVLPPGVTLAALVDRLRELAADRDGAAA